MVSYPKANDVNKDSCLNEKQRRDNDQRDLVGAYHVSKWRWWRWNVQYRGIGIRWICSCYRKGLLRLLNWLLVSRLILLRHNTSSLQRDECTLSIVPSYARNWNSHEALLLTLLTRPRLPGKFELWQSSGPYFHPKEIAGQRIQRLLLRCMPHPGRCDI
jgi:hypothetical protein